MLLLNFGHPLTDAQLAHIRELVGRDIERIRYLRLIILPALWVGW